MITKLIEVWQRKLQTHYNLYIGLKPIGEIWIIKNLDNDKICELASVEINENLRNKGYGKQLMTHALEIVKKRKYKIIQLEVEKDNLPAFKLYSRFGFKEVNRYDEDFKTILKMELVL